MTHPYPTRPRRRLALCALAAAAAWIASVVFAPSPTRAQPRHAPDDDSAYRLQRLTYHLEHIRAEAASDRKLAGWPLLTASAYLTTLTLAYLSNPPYQNITSDVLLNVGLPGAATLTVGTLILVWSPYEERASAELLARASGDLSDPADVRALIDQGERLMLQLAEHERCLRYVYAGTYASLSVISAVAVAQNWIFHDPDRTVADGLHVWFPFGVVLNALAMYELIVPSEAEDARDAYFNDVKRRIPNTAIDAPKLRLAPSLMPQGGGLAASLTW